MPTFYEEMTIAGLTLRKFVFEVLKELRIDKLVEWLNNKLTNKDK